MVRRNIALVALAVASLALAACADPTGPEPRPNAAESESIGTTRCGVYAGPATRC